VDAKSEIMNQTSDHPPTLREPWKACLAIVALRSFRALFGKWALRHLNRCVAAEPKASAFFILGLLLRPGNDPVFVWHLFCLLRKVPESAFEDKWVSMKVVVLDNIPGVSISERVDLCERNIFRMFNLGSALNQTLKANA